MQNYFNHPFEPIIDEESEILILGTFPSIKSFENDFYYSHKNNQFWRLVASTFNEDIPKNINEKLDFLKRHKIALWDVVKSCKRENSSDSNLKDIELNDINALLRKYPNIKKVGFTSKKALNLAKKLNLNIKTFYLPSPSSAYASMKFDEKLKFYKKELV